MENEGEPARRPGKVMVLLVGFWVVGTVLQAGFGWLVALAGALAPDVVGRIGAILGWGLLVVLSFWYRREIDGWLRR